MGDPSPYSTCILRVFFIEPRGVSSPPSPLQNLYAVQVHIVHTCTCICTPVQQPTSILQ